MLTKAGAQPGDKIVLTKPLGAGIITTALKGEVAEPAHVEAAVESMKRLSGTTAKLIQEIGVNASTDITGFGVLGHSYEMAEKSGVKMRLYLDQLPFLAGAARYADEWLFPGGAHNNQGFYERHVSWADTISEETRLLLYTPETSGGLLVSVPPGRIDALLTRFAAAGEPVWVIGEALDGVGLEVVG